MDMDRVKSSHRRATLDGRDVREKLLAIRPQIGLLPSADRVLLELVPTGDRSVREVARLLGVNPGWLSRRYHAILRRVQDPQVAAVLSPACDLPVELRQIAIERWLLGTKTSVIADRHKLSRARVDESLAFLNGYLRGRTRALTGVELTGAKLTDAKLTGAKLTGVDLTDFPGARPAAPQTRTPLATAV